MGAMEDRNKKPASYKMPPGSGIALGMALGVALGTAMDNVGLGIAIGICIGVVFDANARQGK